ncbi:Protein of unknown function DUF998 [Ignisphaera aggregans DSM 17230]|uniref:DUF998 domain-containing protein n=1 Tax=Ignisphaera aggregans (strain DSM 17230 / JCM 13409 / AQ1.S1) TaxID=583356 RepID=E0SQU4_IGNAA|nr:Protein of unknown function DUF998 [Ignisphaera aggregans DSM 17230]
MKINRLCILVALSSFVIPLLFISIAIAMSDWFNIYDNALSDLGHATRSKVAPIFNIGLSLGAFLLTIFAINYVKDISRILMILLLLCAFLLNLVAVFDEVYGKLHYWVSVAFFISLALLLAGYGYFMKQIVLATIAIAIGVIAWYIHMVYRIPRGAAIPELISIFISIPFLIVFAYRNVCRE